MRTRMVRIFVLCLASSCMAACAQGGRSPLPEGQKGIAARYPGDVGIARDRDVIFVEKFDDSLRRIASFVFLGDENQELVS